LSKSGIDPLLVQRKHHAGMPDLIAKHLAARDADPLFHYCKTPPPEWGMWEAGE
jgi:hypothetical protein